MKRNSIILVIAPLLMVLLIGVVYFSGNNDSPSVQSSLNSDMSNRQPTDSNSLENSQNTSSSESADQLQYLIEEEKLAHDVYMAMYEKYGMKVFSNIMESEMTHQDKVLSLLESRQIDDPRSQEMGVFQNKELQDLYDSLIEMGNKGQKEAIEAGIIIEERDIADLTKEIDRTTDEEIKSTLIELRKASENHLRAFQRQL